LIATIASACQIKNTLIVAVPNDAYHAAEINLIQTEFLSEFA